MAYALTFVFFCFFGFQVLFVQSFVSILVNELSIIQFALVGHLPNGTYFDLGELGYFAPWGVFQIGSISIFCAGK